MVAFNVQHWVKNGHRLEKFILLLKVSREQSNVILIWQFKQYMYLPMALFVGQFIDRFEDLVEMKRCGRIAYM